MSDHIFYEQPLNEIIRTCLRLELLFRQIDEQRQHPSEIADRNLIKFILDVLNLLDRSDLRAKLAKELANLLANLSKYGNTPNVDAEKLTQLTQQLDGYVKSLIDTSGKIGQRLRDIELLNALRLHLVSPGGGCSFDLPIYYYWLRQSAPWREAMLADWLGEFVEIKSIVTLLLSLVRANTKIEDRVAAHGFYQELLDAQLNLQLIRIGVAFDLAAYPEVSIGRHFMSVRFFLPKIEQRSVQHADNIEFILGYCTL